MDQKLELLISTLLGQLSNSPAGHLPLASRKLLWRSLTAGQSDQARRMTLTRLHTSCVRHGLPFWHGKFSGQAIDEILDVALDAARGEVAQAHAQKVRDDFYVAVVEDQDDEAGDYRAMFVGHAAANTIATAISDASFDGGDERDDDAIDPEAFCPDYLIASAVAGGLAADGDSRLRSAFWQWYLTHAVRQVVVA